MTTSITAGSPFFTTSMAFLIAGSEVAGILDRPRAVHAIGLGEHRIIDVRIEEAGADLCRIHPPLRPRRHVLDVHQFLMIGARLLCMMLSSGMW